MVHHSTNNSTILGGIHGRRERKDRKIRLKRTWRKYIKICWNKYLKCGIFLKKIGVIALKTTPHKFLNF